MTPEQLAQIEKHFRGQTNRFGVLTQKHGLELIEYVRVLERALDLAEVQLPNCGCSDCPAASICLDTDGDPNMSCAEAYETQARRELAKEGKS